MPIVTLLTDFGSQDYFAGAMKGVILSGNPAACIVDITHEIPPQDIEAAAFNLLASYGSFPAGTIHVAVVDPGVGSDRRPLLIESAGQFFVGPDNGIFSWICEREANCQPIHLTNERFFRRPVSRTFHGRDIFAPVAAALSNGIPIGEFGEKLDDVVRLRSLRPEVVSDGRFEGRVIHIDRFGNCITNLTRDHLPETSFNSGAKLVVNGREISAFRPFFTEAGGAKDELFCLFGSAGFLEISVRDSSAERTLRTQRGEPVVLVAGRAD